MTDIKYQVAATAGVTILFILQLGVSETLPEGTKKWGVLVSLVIFVLLSSFAGIKISKRMYS